MLDSCQFIASGKVCSQRTYPTMAAFESSGVKDKNDASVSNRTCLESVSQCREMIKPSITELTKEVRTNILCTVEGCGKILPNTPALNMHLVKSHRIKEGIVNPTVRKDMKGSQKLYCCPIDGCPRGPSRPFSQFSLVKQHFMKMHAEKKHKCSKCNNGYSTEWDLKRHIEDCGKTYQCTCGCPYASRAALLSHIYRTGHEIPTEHRIPPVKKRKMEKELNLCEKIKDNTHNVNPTVGEPTEGSHCHTSQLSDTVNQRSKSQKTFQKLLLPKPNMALVSVPVMQLAHLPVLLPSSESGALRSVVLAIDNQGSVGTLHLVPQGTGGRSEVVTSFHFNQDPISVGIQANLDSRGVEDSTSRGRSMSTNIQTDQSYLSKQPAAVTVTEGMTLYSVTEPSVSSCSQTDISVSAQVLLPVNVETQTSLRTKSTASIGAQTENLSLCQIPCSSSSVLPIKNTQTQTFVLTAQSENKIQNHATMSSDPFNCDYLTVSTQTTVMDLETLNPAENSIYGDMKSASSMCFAAQTEELNPCNMADNQTQTMSLLNDLENILSDSMSSQVLTESSAGCGSALGSAQDQHSGIDFDFEEFLSAVHIQTQTEESEFGGLGTDTHLESLDIQTQTDFLLMDELDQTEGQIETKLMILNYLIHKPRQI
uniref:ATM interactor n=1 Tax=Neogobius melanostomus TaxID=47308 RepID=A0A8C6SI77_9GOBI